MDLFEGRTFPRIEAGVGYAGQTGLDTIIERGRLAAEDLPAELIYAGFSLGVLPAQMLAQTRPGARGALLLEACVPASEFGSVEICGAALCTGAAQSLRAVGCQQLLIGAAGSPGCLFPGVVGEDPGARGPGDLVLGAGELPAAGRLVGAEELLTLADARRHGVT